MIINSPLISGSAVITGDLTVSGSISGEFRGSVENAISASYAETAESVISASYAETAGSAISATNAEIATNATNATNAISAQTASYADNFTVAGTLTAQKLVVETVSSSVVYSSGSNVFGNSLSNTQTMSGSVSVVGSLSVNNSTAILSNQTSSMSVANAASVPYSGLTGTVPTWNQNTTGNAATSTTWQTARTLTIGNTGKSINGGSDTSFTLNEIGAYAATNPNGYTTNTGTVTSVGGTGTVSGLTLSGTVSTSGNLTLGGSLSLTSGQITTGLGYTPYNATNPNGYTTNTGTVTSVGGTGGYGGLTLSGTVTSTGNLTLGGTPTGTWPISVSGTSNNITAYTINQSVGTGNGPTFADVYVNGWFRNNNINTGLYNQATSNHLYSENNGSWTIGGPNTTYGELRLRQNHQGAYKGSFYWDASGVGLLNDLGGWGVRLNYGGGYGGSLFGSWTSTGDHRAPIFYDSNNTGYYLDPASTSELNKVYYNSNMVSRNYGIGQVGLYDSTRYQAVFSMGEAYILPANGTNVGSLYGIAWSHPNAGGAAGNLASHGMLILENGGFQGAWGGGSLRTPGDIRGTIFYDWNNTTYYVDPSSISSIRTVGSWRSDSSSWDGEFNGKIQYHSNHWYIQAADLLIYRNSGGSNVFTINQSGVAIATGDMRAPIFYDSNNTAYYGDFASTSRINTIQLDTLRGPQGDWLLGYQSGKIYSFGSSAEDDTLNIDFNNVYFNPGTGALGNRYFRLNKGGSNDGGFLLSRDNALDWQIVNLTSTGNLAFYSYGSGTNVLTLNRSGGSVTATGDMRAPIFYDSNNTGYYLDPASTSFLYNLLLSGAAYFRPQNWIQLDGAYGIYWPNNNGAHIYPNTTSYTQLRLDGSRGGYGGIWDSYSAVNGIMYDSGGNGGVYREANGRWYFYYNLGNDCMGIGTSSTNSTYSLYLNKGVFAQSRIDATIFYDSNNTGYYLDPASTTNVNIFYAQESYTYNWFRNINSNTGLYNQATTQHLSSNTNGYWDMSSTTSISAIRFYTGGHVSSLRGFVYADSSNNIGFLTSDGNWAARVDSSKNLTVTGDVTAFSDARVKENVVTVENALEKTLQLRGVYYNRIDSDDKKQKIGVIAQETLNILPEVVGKDSEGMYNVAYGNMAGLFIEAIKEQQQQINKLTELINNLTK